MGLAHTFWDQDYQAPAWGQTARRLSRAPDVLDALARAVEADPALAGRLADLAPLPELSQTSLFYSGRWRDADYHGVEALVKLDCTPMDFFWARALSAAPEGITPALYASGESLGGADLRWLVMERVPFRFIDQPDGGGRWDLIARAAARFQAAAAAVADPLVYPLGAKEWRMFLTYGIQAQAPRAAERLLERLDEDWRWLDQACPAAVNVGDLHVGNILYRAANAAAGQVVLIDPLPRWGPWAFDPAYCQSISAHTDVQLVARMARDRQELGLPTGDPRDVERIAALLLGWLSVMWWGITPKRREDKVWEAQAVRCIEAAV